MDVPQEGGGGTRRRRRARRAKTQRGGGEDSMAEAPTHAVTVEKTHNTTPSAPTMKALTPEPVAPAPQVGGRSAKPTVAKQLASKPTATAAPVVVLAPAKKQAKAKLMLVSKKAVAGAQAHSAIPKTFKAKRVRVTIDNTARTQKRRRQVLRSVDSLTEEQLREQAVKFGLSRADSVKKVPQDLLRKMLKDYYAMRKGFL